MAQAEVHHRSTTKHAHKPFKSRHATKSQLKEILKGRVNSEDGKRNRKPLQQQIMSKIDRRNQARQQRQNKKRENADTNSPFSGRNGAPRIVAIVPLSSDIDVSAVVRSLSASLDIDVDVPAQCSCSIRVDRFKQNIQFILANGELFSSLDACRVADFIVFVFSACSSVGDGGKLLLRTVEGQGVSTVISVVQGLEEVDVGKKRTQTTQNIKSFISHYFPGQEKIASLGSGGECSNIMRSLCTMTPKGIHWRDDRSWMLADEVDWIHSNGAGDNSVWLTGVVRGRPLQANRLLQVGDWGSFQIDKIFMLPTEREKRKAGDMAQDSETKTEMPDSDQDNLDELAPDDLIMDDHPDLITEAPTERKGVLLDDHHYFSDEELREPIRPKRLPKGTSQYQAAWYLDNMSDSGSDLEEVELDTKEAPPLPEDGIEGLDAQSMQEMTEAGPSEYPHSEAFDIESADETTELAEYRARRKAEAKEDAEFPDEIELAPNILARERLSRYRGLKSLRTSRWETSEDKPHEPVDWNRLLRIPHYPAAKSQATREALVGKITPGMRVQIQLRNVPSSIHDFDKERRARGNLLTAFSLLRHEQKLTTMHYSFHLNSDYPEALKSKSEVVVQCGPRRFVAQPIFSAPGTTQNDVHKFERYLHPGGTAVASMIAPITWGAVPTMFFSRGPALEGSSGETSHDGHVQPLSLIGTGTVLPPSSSRVVAKRIVLTGHPYRINRRLVTIRYMFFNNEDVRWFAALPLWTRRGRSGFIKEPLGTHGHFKATFDGRINPQDAVGVSLYKRVWPRRSKRWGLAERAEEEERRETMRNGTETDRMVVEWT